MEATPATGAVGVSYIDSVDSSPRSRGGESWDELPFTTFSTTSSSASRLRFMCSYGGRIVPRPTDKSLCYLGGDTRIVHVDRNSSLLDIVSRLSRTLLDGRPFSLKYQLPAEDLDSLISVSTDEDLENMIDEYDRLTSSVGTAASGGTSSTQRIRLFLFPSKSDSNSSSIGSILDDSSKSETWFVDALNSAIAGTMEGIPRNISADSTSVNCLLGLEDDSSVHSRASAAADAAAANGTGDQKFLMTGRQEAQSVPDSPMLDKSSSFGSTSSALSLSSLPPIRVRPPNERMPDINQGPLPSMEEKLARMTIATPQSGIPQQQMLQQVDQMASPPLQADGNAPMMAMYSPETANRAVLSPRNEELVPLSNVAAKVDAPALDSATVRPNYYEEPKHEFTLYADKSSFQNPAMASEPSYPFPNQLQQQQSHHHHHQQQQQQQHQSIIAANHHFIQHPSTGPFVPIQSYYPLHSQSTPSLPQQQQLPAMYYVPVHQTPPAPYNLVDTSSVPSATLPAVATMRPEMQPATLYRSGMPMPAPATAPLQPSPAVPASTTFPGMAFHVIHHPHPSQSFGTMANYAYEIPDAAARAAQVYHSQATSVPLLGTQQFHQTIKTQTFAAPDMGGAQAGNFTGK